MDLYSIGSYLASGSIGIAALTAWSFYSPSAEHVADGYIPIGEEDHQRARDPRKYLILNSISLGLILVGLLSSAFQGYLFVVDEFQTRPVLPALIFCSWLAILGTAPIVNRPVVAQGGGHFALVFIILLLTVSESIHLSFGLPNHLTVSVLLQAPVWSQLIQILASTILFIMTGAFSDMQLDDDAKISHENGASVFSRLAFTWLTPLIVLGNKRPLEQEDLWNLIEGDQTHHIIREYLNQRTLRRKSSRKPTSLFWDIFSVVKGLFLYQMGCAALSAALAFASPFFLYQIITEIQKIATGTGNIQNGWLFLLSLFGCSCFKALVDGQMYFTGRRLGTRIRSILIAELYFKSLRRAGGAVSSADSEDEGQASLGKIVTLMSVDSERIRTFVSYFHHIVIEEPISLVLSLVGLFTVLGWSAMSGLTMIILMIPLSMYLGSVISRIQEELMSNTDSRISLINETLQGIRIIKYFAWEKDFESKISEVRRKELYSNFRLWGAWIGFSNIGFAGGLVVAFITFSVYTLVFGKTLDAATAFTAINLLRTVSQLLAFLPTEAMNAYKAKISLDRISRFLQEDELDKYLVKEAVSFEDDDDDDIASDVDTLGDEIGLVAGFIRAHFSYYGDSGPDVDKIADDIPKPSNASSVSADATSAPSFTLRELDIEFPLEGLTVIAGPTGSGKSSLILALLGEMKRLQGRVFFPDSRQAVYDSASGTSSGVAYVAQTAWLLNATVRENILFGEPYDPVRYKRVIHACALAKDLENLDGGDLTEIGEKGINMSGGQKQRIALARAAYSTASFVLLDDPLSAVDAPTAKHLLFHCLLNEMKGRTVILVSHAVNLVLPYADFVVSIKNGEVACQGVPEEIVNNPLAEGLYNIELLAEPLDEGSEFHNATAEADHSAEVVAQVGTETKLVQDEEKATGSVQWKVYKSYFAATGGIFFVCLFLTTFILTSGAQFADDWWLKTWTDHNAELELATTSDMLSNFIGVSPDVTSESGMFSMQASMQSSTMKSFMTNGNGTESQNSDVFFYVGVYALFGLGVIFANNLQIIVFLWGSLVAAKTLHDKLLKSVLRAPLRFFEVTPIGRILNRFSKDIENIDGNVMDSVQNFIAKIIQGITIISIIAYVSPSFLLFAVPMVFVYMYVARMYLNASRELKRLESVSRSPIYAQFSETLAGVTTIRAYGAEHRFVKANEEKVDINHSSFFFIWAANRWLCLRTDIMSAMVVFGAGVAVLSGKIDAGLAALTITYALDFTNALLWTIRMHAEMEMSMNSMERVEEYTSIPSEPPEIIENNRPEPEWPTSGRIQVKDLVIKYAPDLPDVLQGISFSVQPSEKVAVVGRTGAGKSTLSLAFFRILPISGGSIEIDGVDISSIGLFDLRSRLTIIPQDPVLFTGTLRSNLDPTNEHDDASIWEALKSVHILESFQSAMSTQKSNATLLEDGDESSLLTPSSAPGSNGITLDYPVNENGSNFSQGQRQLLCLARALLRRTRVIFLDEATASVDNETDARIQETIRDQFDGTVICIAHRLRTIIDYDKVLVLGKGQVLEYGSPYHLMENSPTQAFRKMCEESGEFEELKDIARAAEEARITRRSRM